MAASNNGRTGSSEMMQTDQNESQGVVWSSVSSVDFNNGPMDYKTMEAMLKAYVRDADSLIDKVSELSIKFADELTKLASLIDPEVNAILYQKAKDLPECPSLSQHRALDPEEIDRKYMEMCDFLDQRAAEKYGKQ